MYRILIVEDDKTLNDTLHYNLTAEGYLVTAVFTASEAVKAAIKGEFDLVILDINLPDFDGFETCKRIKEQKNPLIVFLSARDLEPDILKGYTVGADDYITKPFSLNVLQKKLKALFSRKAPNSLYDDGTLRIDFTALLVTKSGELVELTAMDFRLLKLFTANPGIVLSRTTILEKLYDLEDNFVDEHALTAAISRVRSKIENGGPQYIKTIYGMGYMWTGGQNETR